MKRKIYDQLLLWKEKRKGKSAMMIEGARRVGKSYIVKEFAQKEYKSYILIDFFKVGDDIKDLFKNYKNNLDMLFTYLSTYFSTKLYPRESVIVFDEIEFCPAARPFQVNFNSMNINSSCRILTKMLVFAIMTVLFIGFVMPIL